MMKKFVLLVLLGLVVFVSSCGISTPVDSVNNFWSWFIPGTLEIKTNTVTVYYYEPSSSFSLVSDGIISLSNLFVGFNYWVTIDVLVKKTQIQYVGNEYYPYYGSSLALKVFLRDAGGNEYIVGKYGYFDYEYDGCSVTKEGNGEVLQSYKLLDNGTNTTIKVPLAITTNVPFGALGFCIYMEYRGLKDGQITKLSNMLVSNTFVRLPQNYYVETIPLSNNLSNFPDTFVYLYRWDGMWLETVGTDDDSGYSNRMSMLYKPLAFGNYYVKVLSKSSSSNNFAVYYGISRIFSNDYVSVTELSNYSLSNSIQLLEGVPTNSWIDVYTERWYKIVVSNY